MTLDKLKEICKVMDSHRVDYVTVDVDKFNAALPVLFGEFGHAPIPVGYLSTPIMNADWMCRVAVHAPPVPGTLRSGTYQGAWPAILKGQKCIVKVLDPVNCEVQFDDLSLGPMWCGGWSRAFLTHVDLDPIEGETEVNVPLDTQASRQDEINPELLSKRISEW